MIRRLGYPAATGRRGGLVVVVVVVVVDDLLTMGLGLTQDGTGRTRAGRLHRPGAQHRRGRLGLLRREVLGAEELRPLGDVVAVEAGADTGAATTTKPGGRAGAELLQEQVGLLLCQQLQAFYGVLFGL